RTFISIARADGAVADTLHFATHGPDGDIMDEYTTLPWPALCAEVAKFRISLNNKKRLELPAQVRDGAEAQLVTGSVTVLASSCDESTKLAERTGLEPAASGVTGRRYNQLNYRSRIVRFSVGEAGFEPATTAL